MQKEKPSLDQWLREAKEDPASRECGMFLFHSGTVRETAKARVRGGRTDTLPVSGMRFSYDAERVEQTRRRALEMPGIFIARVWLASGELQVGDDIMLVLVGGDIRPHVIDALNALVGGIKSECVMETETYAQEPR